MAYESMNDCPLVRVKSSWCDRLTDLKTVPHVIGVRVFQQQIAFGRLLVGKFSCIAHIHFNYICFMKKFAVLKKIGDYNADVVREFDECSDAEQFRALLTRSETKEYIKYYVAENLSFTDPKCALQA